MRHHDGLRADPGAGNSRLLADDVGFVGGSCGHFSSSTFLPLPPFLSSFFSEALLPTTIVQSNIGFSNPIRFCDL